MKVNNTGGQRCLFPKSEEQMGEELAQEGQ